jgi:hypothetical protein
MRPLLLPGLVLIAAVSAGAQAPVRDAVRSAVANTAVLEGVVVSADATPRPIRRARVSLTGSDGLQSAVVITDDEGRFRFDRVEPGRYTVGATKPGHLRASYGARRFDGAGTPISVMAGQTLAGLTLTLPRGGVISGTLVDHTGMPAVGVQVRAMLYRTQPNGARTPVPAGTSANDRTDDRGAYRLYGLPPGDYLIVANPQTNDGPLQNGGDIRAMTEREIREALAAAQQPSPAQTAGRSPSSVARGTATGTPRGEDPDAITVGFAPIYYPGTSTAAQAVTVTLALGEERTEVSFPLEMVRTTRIAGQLSTPSGLRPEDVQVWLLPVGDDTRGLPPSIPNRARGGEDGRFSFRAVPPGQYTLYARTGAGPITMVSGSGGDRMMVRSMSASATREAAVAGAPVYWGALDLSVSGQPVSGLVLSLQPALSLTGRITLERAGASAPSDLSAARVSLVPDASSGPAIQAAPQVTVAPDGTFTMTGVVPGRYRLNALLPTGGGSWQLKAASVGGRDAFDLPVQIESGDGGASVQVTLTTATQRVSGQLQDASGRPAPDYTILVFPADPRYWPAGSRRIRTTRPATDGRFTIANLPAGEYRIAALSDLAPDEAYDPAFLQSLRDAALPLTLVEEEQKVQDFRIGR